MHVFDDQEHRAVQSSHLPVQGLEAAPVDSCAVHQLPRVTLSPGRHVGRKLSQEEKPRVRRYPARGRKSQTLHPIHLEI